MAGGGGGVGPPGGDFGSPSPFGFAFAGAAPGGGFFSEALVRVAAGEDFPVQRGGLTNILLLARTIYAAAAAQYRIPNAMEGVGHVIRNRVEVPGFSKTYEGVIYQRGQFAEVGSPLWREAGNPAALRGDAAAAYSRALTVAEGIYYGTIPDPTGGAVAFHSIEGRYTHPGSSRWEFIKEIGPFKFFK